MSSAKGEGTPSRPPVPVTRTGAQERPRGLRSASIARSITWGFWWRKVVNWLCFDVVVLCLLGAAFTWHCSTTLPATARDGIEMSALGVLSYAAVAVLEYRKIGKVPMDEALKNAE